MEDDIKVKGYDFKITCKEDVLPPADLDVMWKDVKVHLTQLGYDVQYCSTHFQTMTKAGVTSGRLYATLYLISESLSELLKSFDTFYRQFYCEIFYDIYQKITNDLIDMRSQLTELQSKVDRIAICPPSFGDDADYSTIDIVDQAKHVLKILQTIISLRDRLCLIHVSRTLEENILIYKARQEYYRSDEEFMSSLVDNFEYELESGLEYIDDEDEKIKHLKDEVRECKKALHSTAAGGILLENKAGFESAVSKITVAHLRARDEREFFFHLFKYEMWIETLDKAKSDTDHFPICYNSDQLRQCFNFLVKEGFIPESTNREHFLYYLGAGITRPKNLSKIEFILTESPKQLLREFIMALYKPVIQKRQCKKSTIEDLVPRVFCYPNGKPVELAKPKKIDSFISDRIQKFFGQKEENSDLLTS